MPTIRGGDKLAAALNRIAGQATKPALLKVGFLEDATYPVRAKGTLRAEYAAKKARGDTTSVRDDTSAPLNVPTVAAFQEFGTKRIPPRPFFRNMVAAKSGEWPKAIGDLLKANDYDAFHTLDIAGEAIEGQLKQSIIDTNSPPLTESTIRAKGFAKPLVDTGHMLASTGHEVEGG